MRIIKYIGALLGIVVLLFLIVVNFSVVTTNYECKGVTEYKDIKQPLTVYIAVVEYRWWAGLWSESDGNIELEIPNKHNKTYWHLEEVGNNLFIYDEYPKELKGNFSNLSKILALKTPFGFFDGKCEVIND